MGGNKEEQIKGVPGNLHDMTRLDRKVTCNFSGMEQGKSHFRVWPRGLSALPNEGAIIDDHGVQPCGQSHRHSRSREDIEID